MKPESPFSNWEAKEWVERQCEEMELVRGSRNNLIVAVDIIKQRRDHNLYSHLHPHQTQTHTARPQPLSHRNANGESFDGSISMCVFINTRGYVEY